MDIDILNVIFESRVDDLSKITKEDMDYLEKHSNTHDSYNKLKKAVIVNAKDNSNIILNSIDDYISNLSFENGYFNKKYYIQGLCDGINLIKNISSKL